MPAPTATPGRSLRRTSGHHGRRTAAARTEADRLHARVAERLRAAGVDLPPAALDVLADALLADALRAALDWLEPE